MMVHLLISSFSRKGKGRESTEVILEKFGDLGVEVTLIEGETLTDIDVKLRDLVSNGIERIVVAGGDGMIHSAIQAVAQLSLIHI